MSKEQKDALPIIAECRLSAAEFLGLSNMPSAAEWFANLDNPRTRRYQVLDPGMLALESNALYCIN